MDELLLPHKENEVLTVATTRTNRENMIPSEGRHPPKTHVIGLPSVTRPEEANGVRDNEKFCEARGGMNGKSLPVDVRLLVRVTKTARNWFKGIAAHFCEYTKNHSIIPLKGGFMVRKSYLNEAVKQM